MAEPIESQIIGFDPLTYPAPIACVLSGFFDDVPTIEADIAVEYGAVFNYPPSINIVNVESHYMTDATTVTPKGTYGAWSKDGPLAKNEVTTITGLENPTFATVTIRKTKADIDSDILVLSDEILIDQTRDAETNYQIYNAYITDGNFSVAVDTECEFTVTLGSTIATDRSDTFRVE